MVDNDDGNWKIVTSRKNIKRIKAKENQNRIEKFRQERDLIYLKKHPGFQKHRMTREKALHLIQNRTLNGGLFLFSYGRCVGHLFTMNLDEHSCLECNHTEKITENGNNMHCCCSENVKTSLPLHFYLGCDGDFNNYLTLMKEEPLIN
jgi:hypothetical protein